MGEGRRSTRGRRPWWSTWPGSLGLGLASLAMAGTTSALLVLLALLSDPSGDAVGTDMPGESGPGIGWRVFYVVMALLFLALPVFTAWSARRRLLGFLLWGLIGSLVVLCIGLFLLGIL